MKKRSPKGYVQALCKGDIPKPGVLLHGIIGALLQHFRCTLASDKVAITHKSERLLRAQGHLISRLEGWITELE